MIIKPTCMPINNSAVVCGCQCFLCFCAGQSYYIECISKGLNKKETLFKNEVSFETLLEVIGFTYVFKNG